MNSSDKSHTHNSNTESQTEKAKDSMDNPTNTAVTNTLVPNPPSEPPKKPSGWKATQKQIRMAPAAAKQAIESRPLPTKIYRPTESTPGTPQVKSFTPGFASNTAGGPASIAELARALRNDPDLIFEWVYNNVENHLTYGLQKGALGAILDGFGNSFDQADLLVQLFRQAGLTANYVNGTLRMTAAQSADRFGTDPTDIDPILQVFANCLIPADYYWDGTDYLLEFSHTWVTVNIGGTDYVFDPALKTYTKTTGINLATAMSYNGATFLSNANSGATITSDYVQNMNRTNIRNNLDTLASNLVTWIKTNNHGASLDDIMGGRTINQYDAASPLRQTSHPFLQPGSTPTVWTSIPQAYKTTCRVQFIDIDETFNSEDLAGKRMTLFFNGSNQGELRLDGTLVDTSAAVPALDPGAWLSVEVVHPYYDTWADGTAACYLFKGKPYLIGHSFGHTSRGSSQHHSRKHKANLMGGGAATSEPVLGELMAATWKMWDASATQMSGMINRLTNCTTANHHAAGVIGWYDTPFTDINSVSVSTGPLDGDLAKSELNDTVLHMHGVALEAQVFKQMAGIDGVSTTPIVDIASSGGMKIYDASTANWTGTVRPALTNYSTAVLNSIEADVNGGYRVGVPKDGLIARGSWTGYAYYVIPSFGTYGIIGGALKGGTGACFETVSQWVDYANYAQTGGSVCGGSPTYDNFKQGAVIGSSGVGGAVTRYYPDGSGMMMASSGVVSSEPIDMMSGDYLLGQTDITIGSQAFPYGLGFSRSYNSRARYQDGPLGLGWTHNWQMFAQKATDALMGMGHHSTIAAAAAIAELFVAVDIQSDATKPFSKYITCALATQWFIDNLMDNAVMISSGQSEMMHIKLRDGTYTPPKGDNGTVTFVSGAWKYTRLGGSALNFNTDGTISTMTSPAGMTVTFTYTSGKLTSITNGLGRTLTLGYTGTRLTSVSDGTGRSVSYTVDGSKNLTTVTDPNSKSWTFEYDQPGRMTKHFYPVNPTTAIAVNTYDTLDRVKEQRDYQNNLWQYFFAGSRSQELNPNNKGSVIYMNGMGKVVKTINQVGKISRTEYDGRGRVTKAIAPELNEILFVYDVKGRVTQTTAKAKPGSGLSDIVSSATYDTTWNGLKTATDNLGRVFTLNYDVANGNLLSVVSPSVTGLGSSTVSMTYNARGQALTVTSPDGIVSKNTYDTSTEKLTSSVADFGTGRLNLTANFTYNSRGDLTDVQDPRGNTAILSYDVMRRITQATAPSPFGFVTKFTFDDNGNTTKVERQTSDPFNLWQTSQATYSADNKVLTATDPQGNVTTMTYDTLQRLWKVTDAASRVVERFYDDANRISSIKDPSGTTAVTYTYRDNGGLSTIKDARNYTTTYTVDGHDRADKTTYPDSTYEQVTSRDGNSNPLALVTRSGATVTLTYDELNRVKTKAPASQPTVTTVYDIAGRVVTVSTPTVAGDPASGTFTNFYDTAGRFYKEQYPDGLSVTHELDANGNVTKTTYPDGWYIQRVFDQLNRLTDIKLNGAGTSAVQFEYDALSRRTKLTYENGCSTSYGFEVDNDMNLLYLNFVGSSVGFNYGFDNVNQMAKQGTTDPANYRWTPGSPATTTYATANNMNQYGTVGGTGFTYSTDGSLTNDGVNKYEYNTERMLTRVRNAGTNAVIADYLYDPGLRQRQKNVGGTKTNYYYAGWQRLADYDGTANTLQARYVYGTGLDEVLIQVTSGGTKTYFHQNHQGSVVATTNSSGGVTNTFKYSPFGESSSLSGMSHGYTGQRPDPESGLYYYKMRHYSPKLGRFLQADPIGYAGGLNMYAYCSNAPMGATDPMGLYSGQFNFYGAITDVAGNWLGVAGMWGGGSGSGKSAGPAGGNPASVGGNFPNGMDPQIFPTPILYHTDEYSDTYISGYTNVEFTKSDPLIQAPDVDWSKLQAYNNVVQSTLGLALHIFQQLTGFLRHAVAVALVRSFLISQGVDPLNIWQEVPIKGNRSWRVAIADLVYMKGGEWQFIEVKTTINTKPDIVPRLTVAQQAVYPQIQGGEWSYARPEQAGDYGGVTLPLALPASRPTSVTVITANFFTDVYAILHIITTSVGG